MRASSDVGDTVIDFFCHSGTTLLAAEILRRRCYTMDNDPVYCEIAIRRLEHFRQTGKRGWQHGNPFEREMTEDPMLRELLRMSSDGKSSEDSSPETGNQQHLEHAIRQACERERVARS